MVANILTYKHIMNLFRRLQLFLARCKDKIDFLTLIVTGGETWVHHCGPKSKWQSLKWQHTSSPDKNKFMSEPCTGKVLVHSLLEYGWPNFQGLSEIGWNSLGAWYSAFLLQESKPAIQSHWRGPLFKCVPLHHNGDDSHNCCNSLHQSEIWISNLIASLIQPSDYHVLELLNDALRGR